MPDQGGSRGGRRRQHQALGSSIRRTSSPHSSRRSRISEISCDTDGRELTDERRYAPTSVPLRRNRCSRPPESLFHFTGIRTRTRGDGPVSCALRWLPRMASRHTRGWTPQSSGCPPRRRGFPAHAGMDLSNSSPRGPRPRLPRTRGDGPGIPPRISTQVWASPHTRGWTRVAGADGGFEHGFPAHAGMDPCRSCATGCSAWLPRTRGDGPDDYRGGELFFPASPHTRGWTLPGGRDRAVQIGFPAHAGVVPQFENRGRVWGWTREPRGLRLSDIGE